jgi:hypothetical protein
MLLASRAFGKDLRRVSGPTGLGNNIVLISQNTVWRGVLGRGLLMWETAIVHERYQCLMQ